MPDTDRTRDQLAAELAELRRQFEEQNHRLHRLWRRRVYRSRLAREQFSYCGNTLQKDPGDLRRPTCPLFGCIIEAIDVDDELFGFDRTAAAIREGCRQDLSSESLIEFVFTRLMEFTGNAPRGDDQTVVVLRCTDER